MAGTQMQLEDWLDDLCVRFIINLPQEDLSSVERICFQVEEAQWFYEDFIRPLDPSLPSMTLRTFCLRIFQHCPLLASFSVENHMQAFEVFLQYKTRIPVRGAILLNQAMDSVVLVKGWKKGANWSFPRGKINKDEDDLDCAVREVYEETGLDLRSADLVPASSKPKYIEISMREQQLRLYVFRDVPMDYNFQPQTRKEISKIQWYKLSELPTFRKKGAQNQNEGAAASGANKFYMVAPFLVPLKKWVVSQKKHEERRAASAHYPRLQGQMSVDEGHTEDEAWAAQATPQASIPSIASLDGATRELHRLLKMQPPTQGLQPAIAQEDKGSALLSILQAKKPGAAPMPPFEQHHPHTSYEHASVNPPQPQNLHRHTDQDSRLPNTQQPPPSFPIPRYQDQHNSQHLSQGQQDFTYSGASQHQQQRSITLVHPQPLPPQVQRAIFNKSTFQEHGASEQTVLRQHQQVQSNDRASPNFRASQMQPPPQSQVVGQQVRPAHLTGQSMALLNAFKRDAISDQQEQQQKQKQQAVHHQNVPSASSAGPSAHKLPPPPPYSQYPQKLDAQSVPAVGKGPAETHRTALLGMFKKAASAESPVVQPQQPASNYASELSTAQVSQQRGNQRFQEPLELSVDSLSINNQQLSRNSQTLATQQGNQNQHLQHSKHPVIPSVSQQPASAAAPEQKRQLLSLFSKQQGRPAGVVHEMGSSGGNASTENTRSRVASLVSAGGEAGSDESSRRGSQTPISPADESFLLGYLQSVTNNVSR